MAKRVIVVGAGIIGASIAWHLARKGASVLVVDAAEPGGVATRASWAWINASWGNPPAYVRLRMRAMAEWKRIDREVPGLTVNYCGGLLWDLEPAALEEYEKEHAALGYRLQRLSRSEILKREPNMKEAPDWALLAPDEAMVEPLAASAALLAAAKAQGAEILAPANVRWLIEEKGRIAGVMGAEGPIHADETVIAAGTGSAGLLESVGIKLKVDAPPGLLTHSVPAPELLHGLVMTPGLHVRQTAEGRLVAGTDFGGSEPTDRPAEMARELHAKVQSMIKGAESLALERFTVGFRPTPADGFPAVGRPSHRDGLYVAVTHSGITLAPAIGMFAAAELLDGQRDPLLAPYHPDRPELT